MEYPERRNIVFGQEKNSAELFDLLEGVGESGEERSVQICGAIPAAVCTPEEAVLYAAARKVREQFYGKDVYLRGLIEFTNYCRNDCRYCGIRRSNGKAERYRLSDEQILRCCEQGYALGFRTFVLQGGEDMYYTDDRICEIVIRRSRRGIRTAPLHFPSERRAGSLLSGL